MRKVAGRTLWIGNAGDLWNPRVVCDAGISAVVELPDNEAFVSLPRELIRCRFPLSDGGDNPSWLLRLAAQTVASLIKAQVPVLVCCSAGMSRSVCVAAAGISLVEQIPFAEAVTVLCEDGPADISPRLFQQIQNAIVTSD